MSEVKSELTDRPVEDLSKPALVAEWSEAFEQIASRTAEDRDAVWDRRRDLWEEMKERTGSVAPECPECGGQSWSQSVGGPKHCGSCDLSLGEEHESLIHLIESYWMSVQSADYDPAEQEADR